MAFFVPVAVNCAFACEMFLKALLPSNAKGHRLKELFEELQPSTKNAIITGVISEIGPKYTEQHFLEDLKANSEIFVEWRYFHEKSVSYNNIFINAFLNELEQFCIDNNIGRIEEPSF